MKHKENSTEMYWEAQGKNKTNDFMCMVDSSLIHMDSIVLFLNESATLNKQVESMTHA